MQCLGITNKGEKEELTLLFLISDMQNRMLLNTQLAHECLQPVGPGENGSQRTVHAKDTGKLRESGLAVTNGLHSRDLESGLCRQQLHFPGSVTPKVYIIHFRLNRVELLIFNLSCPLKKKRKKPAIYDST